MLRYHVVEAKQSEPIFEPRCRAACHNLDALKKTFSLSALRQLQLQSVNGLSSSFCFASTLTATMNHNNRRNQHRTKLIDHTCQLEGIFYIYIKCMIDLVNYIKFFHV